MVDPLVKNAADPSQVGEAKKKEKSQRDLELDDIRKILSEPVGRRVLWRWLKRAKTFESIWEPSAKIHYNAGLQDFGHFLLAEVTEADENLLFKMMSENKKEK